MKPFQWIEIQKRFGNWFFHIPVSIPNPDAREEEGPATLEAEEIDVATKREPAVLLRIKYDDNYLSAPTIAPIENVDDEESAPTVATEDALTPFLMILLVVAKQFPRWLLIYMLALKQPLNSWNFQDIFQTRIILVVIFFYRTTFCII